jgi:hypothetical protein
MSTGTHAHAQTAKPAAPASARRAAAVRDSLAAPGRPLDPGVRRGMEARFGRDLSDVRVHSDGKSAHAAQALGANAFTVGRDIAFDRGRYDVATPQGLGTLAHELTHVVQQTGPVEETAAATVDASPSAETAAERNAARVETGDARTSLESGPALAHAGVQRQTAQGAQQPQTAPADQESREAAWENTRLHVIPELLIKFQEIGRVVAVDARRSIDTTFQPYDDSVSTPSQTFLSIFLGGAGNVPQGELGGFLGGAGAAGLQAIIGAILDTTSVAAVKERARTIPEDVLAENLTTSSQFYQDFESGALADLRTEFDDLWAGHHDSPSDLRINDRILQQTARMNYGASSAQGQRVRAALRALVDRGMVPIREQLDDAQDAAHRKRNLNIGVSVGVGAGALGGGIAGGVIGGRHGGGAAGGAAGAAIGALIGGLGAGLAGLGIAALANAFSSTPRERREQAARRRTGTQPQ